MDYSVPQGEVMNEGQASVESGGSDLLEIGTKNHRISLLQRIPHLSN